MEVRKRNGKVVPFQEEKITQAIFKAAQAVGGNDHDLAEKIAKKVVQQAEESNASILGVEDIQDIVERTLIKEGFSDTAKAYILYRQSRKEAREFYLEADSKLKEVYETEAEKSNMKRDNANVDGKTAMGKMLQAGSESTKLYVEKHLLSPSQAAAHREGDIHIHDMDFYPSTLTCCQIDLDKLLKDGFNTGHGYLREPNSIGTAAQLAAIAIQSNQNDQHGGQSIPNFDYALGKYVAKTFIKEFANCVREIVDIKFGMEYDTKSLKDFLYDSWENNGRHILDIFSDSKSFVQYVVKFKDDIPDVENVFLKAKKMALKKTDTATHQAMEGFVHNMNTLHSRAGAQTPFSSINYGTDTSPEGRMIINNVLKATDEGLGHGETAIFPIHIFKVKEGVNYNPEDPNYDLFKFAIRVSAKRLFPNFSFLDAPYNKDMYVSGKPETEVAYMGCRTRVMSNVYDKTKAITFGRGNLSFTSINLPRLGVLAEKDKEKFFKMLDEKCDLVMDQLYDRFLIQSNLKVKNFPFLMGQGVWLDSDKLDLEDKVGEVIKHGTLTVGFIGLAECLTALIGEHHGESQKAQELGLEIVGYIRKKADERAAKTHLNYSVIATPAEGLSGRFVRIDKKRFGVIPGVTDKDYYTNSFHIPVSFPISAFDKIKLEAPYHALTNGGHITYVEMDGDPLKNLSAFEAIVRCMKESGVGYGSINHPVDRCPDCGYQGIIDNECPICGSKTIERIRRITGYLVGTMDRWNDAKRAEEHDRVKHSTMEKL